MRASHDGARDARRARPRRRCTAGAATAPAAGSRAEGSTGRRSGLPRHRSRSRRSRRARGSRDRRSAGRASRGRGRGSASASPRSRPRAPTPTGGRGGSRTGRTARACRSPGRRCRWSPRTPRHRSGHVVHSRSTSSRRTSRSPSATITHASRTATSSKLRVAARSASRLPVARGPGPTGARREPDRVDRDREEGREEVTPGDVRPVPGARGEHEPDEHELGRERDNGLRVRQPRDEDSHQDETQRDRQCIRGARERDQRVLRAQPEHVVDQRRGADVRRADDAVCDRVGAAVGEQLLERREVPPLVEPRGRTSRVAQPLTGSRR